MTTSSKRRMTTFGFMLVPDDLDKPLYNQLEQAALELEALHHAAIVKVKEIDGSDSFTSRGKKRKKQALMRDLEESLEKYTRLVLKPMQHMRGPSIALELEQLREQIKPQPSEGDPTLGYLKLQEIRNLLRTQEPAQREVEIRKQAAAGNFTYLQAALESPEGPDSYLLPKTAEELTQRRIIDQSPEAWARITQLELGQSRMLQMIKSFKASLAKQGIEAEEPEKQEIKLAG